MTWKKIRACFRGVVGEGLFMHPLVLDLDYGYMILFEYVWHLPFLLDQVGHDYLP
jgi:hypothetical protein